VQPPIRPRQVSAPLSHRPATSGRSRRWLTGLAVWLAAAAVAAEDYPPWDRLAAGPYGVGFKVEQRYDYSRPYRLDVAASRDQHARPIRMFIWYPARHRPQDRPFAYGESGADSGKDRVDRRKQQHSAMGGEHLHPGRPTPLLHQDFDLGLRLQLDHPPLHLLTGF